MKWLSDKTVERLRQVAELPDLSGTKYRLLEELGRGGMGTVYLAEDAELERCVALKVLQGPEVGPEAAERLLREARIMARLEHPGIVPIHDVGRLPDGRVFYVMKRVRGRRLDRHLEATASLADRLRIFTRICETVAFAHAQGAIHRDLKPDNILVGEFGEVLIMDWGVAKLLDSAEPAVRTPAPAASAGTVDGVVVGTPDYMAPEQARGEIARVDRRSDVYALGAILERLGGESLPRPLAAICRKALAPEPSGRYPGAAELGSDVSRFLDRLSVTAYRENAFERSARWVSRNRTAVLLVAAYLLARLLLFLLRPPAR